MLRLANELHDLPPNPRPRQAHLLRGVCALTHGTHALLFTDEVHGDGSITGRSAVVSEGWDAAARAGAERYFQRPAPPDPMAHPAALAAATVKDGPVTRARHELVDDAAWYAHPAVGLVRRQLGVDHCLYSLHPLGGAPGRTGWLCLHRPWGHPRPFGPRERTIVHALHSELAWVHEPPAAPVAPADRSAGHELSHRQRQTLDRLLAGRSEKQVAADLGLSRHTVHVHVKSLYKAFGVNSRHELLAKFIDRRER